MNSISQRSVRSGPLAILAAITLFAIAGFFLLGEHRVHALGLLPWLLLLACPFLHVFMHGNHGGHEVHGGS